MHPFKHKLAKEWIYDEASPNDVAKATWEAMDAEFKANRKIQLAEVPRSEMDNFNTPDLEQAPDSYLKPGETLEDFDVTFRRPNADGGRIGFYKGESVVKSHGQQIKDLTEAGESSVSIAKKLGLKQQTVNGAMDAMDKGLAGEEFKLNKPRSEIIKLAVNETGVNLKDPKHINEVMEWIDNNPKANQKDAIKIFGRRKAELVDSKFYGSPGKKWDNEKEKLRRDAEKAWTNRYSNISIEDKTRGNKIFNRHHAGSLREKVGTDNTMFLKAQDNYKNIRPFEDAINDIQKKQYQTNLNRNMPIEKKREIFADLKKQEDALRKKYSQFSDYKSTLVFEETPLSKTGYMMKEEMPNPELTVSEGKTGQKIKYKNITPSSDEGKKAIELNKKSITNLLSKFEAFGCGKPAGGRILFSEGSPDGKITKCAKKGVAAFIDNLKRGNYSKGAVNILRGGGNFIKNIASPKELLKLRNYIGPAALGFMAAYEGGVITDDVIRQGTPLNESLAQNWLTKAFVPYTQEFAKAKNLLETGKVPSNMKKYVEDVMTFQKSLKDTEAIENKVSTRVVDVGGYGNLDGTSMYSKEQEDKDVAKVIKNMSTIKENVFSPDSAKALEMKSLQDENEATRMAKPKSINIFGKDFQYSDGFNPVFGFDKLKDRNKTVESDSYISATEDAPKDFRPYTYEDVEYKDVALPQAYVAQKLKDFNLKPRDNLGDYYFKDNTNVLEQLTTDYNALQRAKQAAGTSGYYGANEKFSKGGIASLNVFKK